MKSYIKTTVMSLMLVIVAAGIVLSALRWLPSVVGTVVVVLGLLTLIVALVITCAGVLVVVRHKINARGGKDLFLKLNESREPGAILSGLILQRSHVRRWVAQRILGHDFIVGDLVEIKTWDEIRTTLDEQGCHEQLPFMPEMLSMCGQRARVFRCMHRLFDYRKTRRMRHMGAAVLLVGTMCNGVKHGGCEASCHTIWKSDWLKRVDGYDNAASTQVELEGFDTVPDADKLQIGTQGPHYVCQLTQLNVASQPIGKWSLTNFIRPLVSGNVAPMAFIAGWLTHLFNEVQHQRQGVGFPLFETAVGSPESYEAPQLTVGNHVYIRTSDEIRTTLNDRLEHRGMGFESDMLKYCGQRSIVQSEIKKLIDIVTGEMRTMKTPAYLLEGIHFSGERQQFNAQYEPLFWRGAWLRRVDH